MICINYAITKFSVDKLTDHPHSPFNDEPLWAPWSSGFIPTRNLGICPIFHKKCFLDPEGESQNAILVVVVLVLGIGSLKSLRLS